MKSGSSQTGYVNVQRPGKTVSFLGWLLLVGVLPLLLSAVPPVRNGLGSADTPQSPKRGAKTRTAMPAWIKIGVEYLREYISVASDQVGFYLVQRI